MLNQRLILILKDIKTHIGIFFPEENELTKTLQETALMKNQKTKEILKQSLIELTKQVKDSYVSSNVSSTDKTDKKNSTRKPTKKSDKRSSAQKSLVPESELNNDDDDNGEPIIFLFKCTKWKYFLHYFILPSKAMLFILRKLSHLLRYLMQLRNRFDTMKKNIFYMVTHYTKLLRYFKLEYFFIRRYTNQC